jgi:filamentous hemagglutinin
LGGHQGGQGKIFGFNYPPKGIVNHILESWAGPHDWLNGWTYDSIGNLRQLNLLETGINTFTNPLNVAIAAPLAIPLALPQQAAAAPGIIYGNRKE